MLLWLTEFLSQYVSGFSVFQYLTLRTMVSVITALAVSLMIGPSMIAWLGAFANWSAGERRWPNVALQ